MRPTRRLVVALVGLIVIDQFVAGVLAKTERHRYEETTPFRFESSDLFALGPLVSYLREHPRGERPRTVFLGNSVMFGFELAAADAVPAQFEALHPETHVYNAAINGFDLGSNRLVASALIESVDRLYVMRGGAARHPLLGSLIPVGEYEVIPRPDPLELRLQSIAGAWRLYGASYRLQAALFGTSARESIHRLTRPAAVRAFPPRDGAVEVTRLRAAAPPDAARRADLQRQDGVLWRFATLARNDGPRIVFLQFGNPSLGLTGDREIADFNAAFAPLAEIVKLTIAPDLLYDGRHLTPLGARRVAEALP